MLEKHWILVFGEYILSIQNGDRKIEVEYVIKNKTIAITITGLLIIVFILYLCLDRVVIEYDSKINLQYNSFDANISVDIPEEDATLIVNILKNKLAYKGRLYCGFSKNFALVVNDDQNFYIAQDACQVIYWENENKYFRLSSEEQKTLYNIFLKHGVVLEWFEY